MIPIEEQVASVDLCKRMVELGAPAETAFYWSWNFFIDQWGITRQSGGSLSVPAYSAQEIWRDLPETVIAFRHGSGYVAKTPDLARVQYTDSLADSLAYLYIAIAEQRLSTQSTEGIK